jgi:two-component system LytT family response regulator
MKLRTIIVDDEKLARDLVREFLSYFDGVQIVEECGDGESMPGCNGFEVLERLDRIPSIVFCTAYEQYAIRAFEVSAVDYLLKPYDRERFAQSMQRVLGRHADREEMTNRMITLMQSLQTQKCATRLFVKTRGAVVPVDISDIEWIQAQGDYSEIHTASASYLSSHSLTHLESLLDAKSFLRIHRSSIVNVSFIQELRKTDSGGYILRVASGRELPIGRTRIDQLKDWIV